MTKLFLEPVDVWLFRNGKPFSAGEDHRAESLFPPLPLTVQGAIRSKELVVSGVNLQNQNEIIERVGTRTDYRNLRITGPILARREAGQVIRYYPQPADAYSVDQAKHMIKPCSPPQSLPPEIKTSRGESNLLGYKDQPEKGENDLWLSESNLVNFLSGETVQAIKSQELFVREPNPGIEQDKHLKTVEEGQLFEVEFIRPQNGTGLYLEVEGYDFDEWDKALQVLRLGGEARAAYISEESTPGLPRPESIPKKFKAYLATPAYFKEGHLPEDWSRFFDEKVDLAAIANFRFFSVGGFDLAVAPDEGHQPGRRFIPAGSVFYFESKGQVKSWKPLTDFGSEIGFGQVIITEKGW